MIFRLNELAYPRKRALEKLEYLSGALIEYIIKCVVYKNTTNNLDHWTNEIADYFYEVNNIRVKSNTGRLKEKDYLNHLFYYQGEDYQDMKVQLISFSRNKDYPDFEITKNLIKELTDKFNSIARVVSKILSQSNVMYKNDFINLVKKLL